MDAEKLIQVSFQIPLNALDNFSRLAEQLRLLTEAVNTQAASAGRSTAAEYGESGVFDPERFTALRQTLNYPPAATSAAVSDLGDARVVSSTVSQTGDVESVFANVQKEVPDVGSAGNVLHAFPAHVTEVNTSVNSQEMPQKEASAPPENTAQTSLLTPAVSVQAEAENEVPNAPEARRDAERQIPEVESARTEAEARELTMAAAQNEVSGGVESPLGMGVVVQTQPEMPQSRWSGVTEELVIPGPAPLTAEAVSLAFERDGRRYDNGFPLY